MPTFSVVKGSVRKNKPAYLYIQVEAIRAIAPHQLWQEILPHYNSPVNNSNRQKRFVSNRTVTMQRSIQGLAMAMTRRPVGLHRVEWSRQNTVSETLSLSVGFPKNIKYNNESLRPL